MNSALAVAIGLTLAIILILKKCLPVYALILGAIVSGLLSGWGFDLTVKEMFSGVKDISPAIVRILAAGVLTGVLVKTGAADKIALTIVKKAGRRNVFLALALSVFILTGVGVFIDVAVITVAPIAIMIGKEMGLSKGKVLLAMIGGGKCGNIVSPNPNTIIAAENYDAPLSSVMAAGIVPAIIGLVALIFIILPMLPDKGFSDIKDAEETSARNDLPSFMASITGPLVAVLLMVLRPLSGIAIDPAIALPVGGLAGVIATRKWKSTGESMSYGLEKNVIYRGTFGGNGNHCRCHQGFRCQGLADKPDFQMGRRRGIDRTCFVNPHERSLCQHDRRRHHSLRIIRADCFGSRSQCCLGCGYDQCRCHRSGPPSSRLVLPRHGRFHRDGSQGKAQADSLRVAYRTGAGEHDGRHDADNKLINNIQ